MHRHVSPRIVALSAFLVSFVLATRASSQIGTDADPTGDLRRARHSGLWPFYSRETYEDGSKRTSSLFGAIRSESAANGDYRHRVIPFYNRIVRDGGRDRQLAIYPLLYLGRESPNASHDVVLPFWARWSTPSAQDMLLWPLFHIASSSDTEPYRFIPTLFSSGTWSDGSQQRLGLPYVFDIFERAADSSESAWNVGAFLPWGPPTRWGAPLIRSRVNEDDGGWHFHIFPLFVAGEGAEDEDSHYVHTPIYGQWKSSWGTEGTSIPAALTWWSRGEETENVNVLFPIFQSWTDGKDDHLRLLPFFAKSTKENGDERLFLPFILGHFFSQNDELKTWDVLWPLIHSSERENYSATRVLPFYDHSVSESHEWTGYGGFVYRRHEYPLEERTAQWFLFPLGLHERSPERGIDWALPFWLRWDETGELKRRQTTLFAPVYFSHEVSSRMDPADTDGEWFTHTSWLHAWPFYGHHVHQSMNPDRRVDTHFTLAPFFRVSKTRNTETGDVTKTRVETPWPLVRHESTIESWDFRILPLVFVGDSPVRSYTTLYPLLSIESGPWSESGFLENTSLIQWREDESESVFHLFPMIFDWRETADSRRITGPLWSFRYRESPTDGWFHLFPIGYGAWEGDRSRVGVFPLYYGREFGESRIEHWSLGRLAFAWNSLRGAKESYDSVLWKALEYSRSTDGDYDFRLLHRFFVNREVSGQRELVLNPIFKSWSDERNGDSSFSLLYFVYRSSTENGATTRRILGIPF